MPEYKQMTSISPVILAEHKRTDFPFVWSGGREMVLKKVLICIIEYIRLWRVLISFFVLSAIMILMVTMILYKVSDDDMKCASRLISGSTRFHYTTTATNFSNLFNLSNF